MIKRVIIILTAILSLPAFGQFDSGSDGSYGPLIVSATDPADVVIDLPDDGIIRATTVFIAGQRTLLFNRNPLNTPVTILATGDVIINGSINVSGGTGSQSSGGLGGQGGFKGGAPGGEGVPAGAGFGPGGGLAGLHINEGTATAAGSGSFATRPANPNDLDGSIYGSPLLVPLIGGSGGGGIENSTLSQGHGGGGGGGALLIASNTRIEVNSPGFIFANGAENNPGNSGSGGAIRLVAPVVEGDGHLRASGHTGGTFSGNGRIRVDTLDRTGIAFSFATSPGASTIGAFMVAIPDNIGQLDIIEAAGTSIPVGSGPVSITLPFGSDTSQNVIVQATGFAGIVDIDVVITPENGTRVVYPAQIDSTGGSPATVTVPVEIPVNTPVIVNVWTR
jgi:hypothetical protein